MYQVRRLLSTLPLAMWLGTTGCAVYAAGISITVNSQPVLFNGASPVQNGGTVLVPLRSVFEAIGANVSYDSASKTVSTNKGANNVSLTVGTSTAIVNGKTESLGRAAEVVNGAVLVPLRFIAEGLGADVQWDEQTQSVTIQTPEAHLSTLPPPKSQNPLRPDAPIVGRLTGIFTDTAPQVITLRVNGQNTVVPITVNSEVRIRQNDQPAVDSNIHALDIGDQIRVSLAPDGSASSIEAVFGEIVGTVKNIQAASDGSYTVNLNDGTSVQMRPDALARMAGRRIDFSDIMAAEHVLIRTDITNKIGYSLDVETESPNGGYETGPPIDLAPNGQPAVFLHAVSYSTNTASTNSDILVSCESPADGMAVTSATPLIYAVLDKSATTTLDSSSIRLLLDGEDITKEATVNQRFVLYQPMSPLSVGEHVVQLTASNLHGDLTTDQWSFTSCSTHPELSFKSDRRGSFVELKSDETLNLTLRAASGGSAFVIIGSVTIPMVEEEPGLYIAHYKATRGNAVQNAAVTAHFCSVDHVDLTASLPQTVSASFGAPKSPKISSPTEGAQIGQTVAVAGQSVPGSTVDITIGYTAKALGMVPITGTAAQTQVIADNDGKWQTDSLALATPTMFTSARDTGLIITATTVDATGQHSVPSSIKVSLQ